SLLNSRRKKARALSEPTGPICLPWLPLLLCCGLLCCGLLCWCLLGDSLLRRRLLRHCLLRSCLLCCGLLCWCLLCCCFLSCQCNTSLLGFCVAGSALFAGHLLR